jgi:hypothetical protein
VAKELRILSPCGILGYGFPEESFLRGIECEPHVIAVDAGSTDAGPHKLGAGVGIVSVRAAKRDLALLMTHAHELQIPLIIGSAGGAGARPHVEWTLRIVDEIAEEERLRFDTAVIYSDVDREVVRRKLAAGHIEPLGPAPEVTEESLAATRSIVAQMGSEPFVEALDRGAQLIVAGRAYDPAPFAAVAIREGCDPGLAIHLGKILECGALCAEPGTAKDAILGRLREDHFTVEALNPERRCSVTSVAAHTLYEKGHPYLLHGPGLLLDLSACEFAQQAEAAVEVRGSRLQVPERYRLKLEGAAQVAFRTFVVAGVRDPILVQRIDEVTRGVVESVRKQYPEVRRGDYEVLFHLYGKNGVMGELEPRAEPGHELGVVIDVVAATQELASAICASARSTMLHFPLTGRKSTGGNLAFPFAPSDVEFGPVYRFTIYHLVEVDHPGELTTIEYRSVG